MKKIFIACIFAFTLSVSGCSLLNHGVVPTSSKDIKAWWGTKAEIKIFLDSPDAKAERWFIQSLGE